MQNEINNIVDGPNADANLFGRTVRGGAWIFALRGVVGFLSFIKQIILLRLLAPTEFGLLGIASLMIVIVLSFTDMGFRQALIQKKENIEGYLNVAWTVNVIRGIVLFLVLYYSAPYLANFFNRLDAVVIIQVIAVSLIFEGFANIGVVYFVKELEFHKKFILELTGAVVSSITVITLAFIYKNVWALVFGRLANSAVRCALSYVLHSYRPKLSFDTAKLKELWSFGKHIFLTKMLNFLSLHGDDIFVGKVLGVTALGFYQKAYEFGNMAVVEIGDKIGEVAFPAFSKLQGNIEKMQSGFLKALHLTSLVVLPITGAIIVLGPEFTRIVLTEKWMPMVPALQILCISGFLKCSQSGPIFMAIGRPDIPAKLAILKVILMAATIYPLTIKYGITGTAICILCPSVILQSIAFYKLEKLVGIKVKDVIKLLFYPFFAILLTMLTVFLIKKLFLDIGLAELVLLICSGAVTYCVIIVLMSHFSKRYNAISLVRNIVKGIK